MLWNSTLHVCTTWCPTDHKNQNGLIAALRLAMSKLRHHPMLILALFDIGHDPSRFRSVHHYVSVKVWWEHALTKVNHATAQHKAVLAEIYVSVDESNGSQCLNFQLVGYIIYVKTHIDLGWVIVTILCAFRAQADQEFYIGLLSMQTISRQNCQFLLPWKIVLCTKPVPKDVLDFCLFWWRLLLK